MYSAGVATVPTGVSPPEFLQLVADPQRWQLLTELTRSDRRVGELSSLLDRPQSLVSYHLGALRNAGVVTARKSSADGRDTYYRVELGRCGELLGAAGAALHPGLRLEPVGPAVAGPWPGRPPVVLFLCTGNSSRSQMAEALLEHLSAGHIRARSAGSHPKALHPYAVRAMAARGIDIEGRPSKSLSRFLRSRFDRVITLCDKVREVCPEFPGAPGTAHWSVPDPAVGADGGEPTYPAFEAVADDLDERIGLLISQMVSDREERKTSRAQ